MMQSRVQLSMAWCRDAVVQVLFLVVTVPGLLAGYAPSAAVGDSGEFLDVLVDPFARGCFWWGTGVEEGGGVGGGGGPEGGAGDTGVVPDPMRAPTSGELQRHNPSFPTRRQ